MRARRHARARVGAKLVLDEFRTRLALFARCFGFRMKGHEGDGTRGGDIVEGVRA